MRTSFQILPAALRPVVAAAAAIALVALPSPAVAQARPDTRAMSCAQAQDLVRRAGAIVLSTGPLTYQRFVTDRRFCDRTEVLQVEYAPTRDTAQCPVAYRCDRLVRPRPQN